jgi:hypothetical protein
MVINMNTDASLQYKNFLLTLKSHCSDKLSLWYRHWSKGGKQNQQKFETYFIKRKNIY